jgi:hypothetical protein
MAKKRGVFKVETIGNCYVAVVGLPQPRTYHDLAMANFARQYMERMRSIAIDLDVLLGLEPLTSECYLGFTVDPYQLFLGLDSKMGMCHGRSQCSF